MAGFLERQTELPPPPLSVQDGIDVQAQMILVNRYRKARKLSQVLLGLGCTAAQAEQIGSAHVGRALTAKAADCNAPSQTTWALVVELVREVRA